MTPVPAIRVTEMLASAFGIHACKVTRREVAGTDARLRFDIRDVQDRCWTLEVSPAARGGLPAEDATMSQGRTALRWGRCWRVAEVLSPGQEPLQATPAVPARPAWTCADGRALERVGSWLAQPAGLPPASDILGQCFLDTWRRHRALFSVMHAQAEALHDGLDHHLPMGPSDGPEGQGAWAPFKQPEAYRHQRVLRQLVEAQECLLGPQAARFSTGQRRAALRRLYTLLEVEQSLQQGERQVSRAG